MMRRLRWLLRIVSFGLVAVGIWYWLHGPTIPSNSYLVLDLAGSYSEARPGGLLTRLIERGRSLSDLTEALRKVRHDGRIAGVLVRVGKLDSGWAQAQEIRGALGLVKAGGKRVIAQLEVELAPANKEIFVASVADAVYVAPAAAPLLTGLTAHTVFLGGVWPKMDVRLQVERVGDYKTIADELSRQEMSPKHREMLESILDDVHGLFVRTVADARNLAAGEIEKAIGRGIARPQQLVEAGIANAVRGTSEILSELGGGTPVATVGEEVYASVPPSSLGIGDGPAIAVVHASGAVATGKSRPSGGIGSRTIAEALAEAAADPSVSAIVLRVASPGGSPAASDEIWLAVREAAKRKPVIASLGDVAASGGYYIASAADRIVAAPGTLTGSIGVVFFKPDLSALLDRAGVHTETLQRGRYARLFDLDKSLDDEELALVRAQIADTYRLFLERVATGRKKKPEDIDRVGGGRVWTGQQAFDRGLVDEIGTMDDAVRAAANAAGIHDTDQVLLVHYPKAGTLAEQIAEAGGAVSASMQPPALARIAAALGDVAAQLELEMTLEPGIQAVAEAMPAIE